MLRLSSMTRRQRLDAELVRRGLARSRDDAARLIGEGLVRVAGHQAAKPATGVTTGEAIVVDDSRDRRWVSRGAYKLLSALEAFEPKGLTVTAKRCLDAGASTGGFTEVLLDRGAIEVVAVDVGYGQLAWSLQTDDRVDIRDRSNIRHLTAGGIGGPVDMVVSDLSFISLTVVMRALTALCTDEGDIVLMVKPQFEVGRDNLGKNGVVRNPRLHVESVLRVCESAAAEGWGTHAVAPSMLPGPAGNVEYFCWLRRDASAVEQAAVERAVAMGPAGETT